MNPDGGTNVPRDLACESSYLSDFPFLTFATPVPTYHLAVDAFLGVLAGSYWYAVFLSSLRPTSRDKTYPTHPHFRCQRVFGDLHSLLMKGVYGCPNGLGGTPNGSAYERVSATPSSVAQRRRSP